MKQDSEDISKLSKILSEKVKESPLDKDKKYQLINLIDDLLLVWCKEEACLYAQILQSLPLSESSTGNKEIYKIQSLVLAKPPIWDVKCMVLNKSGTGVLLIGNEGIAVVELPKRWGNPPLFEGGMDTVTCRVEYVGEQFFMCNPYVKIISADWHPGSLDHTFITILSSDNYLRVYNLSYLDTPEQAIAVAKSSNFIKEGGKFGVGESAVSFGIGPPVCINKEQTPIPVFEESPNIEAINKRKQRYHDLLWPIFILYSNGDVYYTLTSLNKRSMKRKVLYGPLNMLPSSFDNYGVDFCSLLVLPSSPVVLVIANTKGFLHHCIVMDTSDGDEELDDSRQMEDLTLSVSQLSLETSNIYLHVYESVHLNLSYADASNTFTSPIVLVPDPNTPARYWVSHSEGCHGVSVPLVERLLSGDIEFPENDLECHVEHLLCTRPIASAIPCTVTGVCVSPSAKIFILLSSGVIQDIPFPSILLPRVPLFNLQSPESEPSPLRKVHKESFEEHIRSVLQRTLSQPLLTSGSWPEIAPEEYLNLVNKVTNTLRENYIRPQIRAREDIRRRHNILIEQKEHLKRELSVIQEGKKNLTDKAHELAEKYEEANDRHLQIMKRLEVVIGDLVRRMPILSASERGMQNELREMAERSKNFHSQLNQIQSKYEWQTSQREKEISNEALKRKKGSTLSDNQLTCLKMSLGKESDKLGVLLKKINHIKKEVGM